ncbi:transporter substrate-binding domain-containing protein [Geminocystis sp. NIES-3709]|uniref:transporter substrate-binding domain-containing protein n=1 Tax=Geminocystis sp. NIES-3709 TaxID=1617448 RepID=UPI0005FC55BC|nr:transporter substrate-binding domain-containing protein [Geminocystis sp. NIES-3709]BAQ64184.1 extracellular solute-binding protein [Geminocystis sp. NIES-3709]
MIKPKIINLFIAFNISLGLTFFPTLNSKAENILEEINRTGLLKVGIRTDAIPFGYRNNGELQGICVDIVRIIREELRTKIDRDIISIQLIISSLDNRFNLVQDKVVHLECGPNSIRKLDDYNVTFSDAFFISGIQFIVKKDIVPKFIDSQGENFTIGLLRYSNTETLIKEKYPQAQFELFQGLRGGERAIQALKQGRIDAFADDGILLIGQSISQGLSLRQSQDFILAPQPPLTCEQYGLIIPQNDELWKNFLNSIINSDRKTEVINSWFKNFLPSSNTYKTLKNCASSMNNAQKN